MNRITANVRSHVWPIGGMCAAGCATTLERSMKKLDGVYKANANFAAGTLRVEYEPSRLSPGQIVDSIRAHGFSCDRGTPGGTDEHMHGTHGQHAMPMPIPASAIPAAGKAAAPHDVHEGMHHAGDLHAAARDMQRRFLVALIFALPVFLWSPMGLMELLPTPFGLDKNFWLFLLGSGAVLYPGWPFFTAAIRSLRHGVLDMLAFPLAAGVLYPFVLSPEIAALSMSGSSVIVAVNALLLKRLSLETMTPVSSVVHSTPEESMS